MSHGSPQPVRAETVTLQVDAPFDAGSQLAFLERRAIPGLEAVSNDSYSRTLRLPHGPATLRLELTANEVRGTYWLSDPRDLDSAIHRSRWLLDLDVDSATVDEHLGSSPHLSDSVRAHPGLRVPGHVDGFEVAVRAVVGQQISVTGARTIIARLVGEHGTAIAGAEGLTHLFPTAEDLAAADPERLPMPRARGRALTSLAAAVAAGVVVLDRTADLVDVRRSLLELRGIGPWTADYIALRALGDQDVFMGSDLGVRHGLAAMGLADASPAVIDAWRPWRSYASMHVWKALEGATP